MHIVPLRSSSRARREMGRREPRKARPGTRKDPEPRLASPPHDSRGWTCLAARTTDRGAGLEPQRKRSPSHRCVCPQRPESQPRPAEPPGADGPAFAAARGERAPRCVEDARGPLPRSRRQSPTRLRQSACRVVWFCFSPSRPHLNLGAERGPFWTRSPSNAGTGGLERAAGGEAALGAVRVLTSGRTPLLCLGTNPALGLLCVTRKEGTECDRKSRS